MTEMATTPIYGKTLQKFKTKNHMILKLGMRHRGLKRYNTNIYEDFELTKTYFRTMSFFVVGKPVTKTCHRKNLLANDQ